MRLLVSGCTRTVRRLAPANADRLGVLLTPANGNSVASVVATGLPWGIDNAAWSRFDPRAFRRLAARAHEAPGLLWVAVPDVVADAHATLRRFAEWRGELRGLPLAYVLQDGQEALETPWDEIAAVFVGGSTRWKLSGHAHGLVGEARRRGKLAHMGRVNSYRRLAVAVDWGCASVDGGSASRWGDVWVPRYLAWIRRLTVQPVLFP